MTPRPAVRFGTPLACWRSMRLVAAGWILVLSSNLPTLMLVLGIHQIGVAGVVLPTGLLSLAILAPGLLLMFAGLIPMKRTRRLFQTRPWACLNCCYELTPTDRVCHECGRLQNRKDLSPRWAAYAARRR